VIIELIYLTDYRRARLGAAATGSSVVRPILPKIPELSRETNELAPLGSGGQWGSKATTLVFAWTYGRKAKSLKRNDEGCTGILASDTNLAARMASRPSRELPSTLLETRKRG
jgi:hypothetical protein